MITKKFLTIDEGIRWLLKSNKEDALIGVTGVSTSVKNLPIMKDVVFSAGVPLDLLEFLESEEPKIKPKLIANRERYDKLLAKYPLIKVLNGMDSYCREHIKILVDEINKQSKDA
jgi:hypothetical protein